MSRRRITTAQQQQQQRRKTTIIDTDADTLVDEDVFYLTVTRYPGLPDADEQVSLLVTHTNAAAGLRRKKSAAENRLVF